MKTERKEADVIGAFCNYHVRGNVTDLVEYILNRARIGDISVPFDDSDIENIESESCPWCGLRVDTDLLDELPQENDDYDSEDYSPSFVCPHCGKDFTLSETIPCCDTVDEWLLVSAPLGRKLADKNEVVLCGKYWGRDSDYGPYIDSPVIRSICDEIEVLPGQKHYKE